MNRGTGLLLAREKLAAGAATVDDGEDGDFVLRNIAKAQLALGDAVLTVFGQYHWSCRERASRLTALPAGRDLPWLDEVRQHHAVGVEFKLRPRRNVFSAEALRERLQRVVTLAETVWLWLESKRLRMEFASVRQYVTNPLNKCPETDPWRNRLLNTWIFGRRAFRLPESRRHPRERILNALAILLWDHEDWENRVSAVLRTGLPEKSTFSALMPMDLYRAIWERVR